MKNIKEFIPLWKLVKEDKCKFIIATSLIIISNFLGVVSGYLIGEATQYLTDTKYTMSILYLVIYIIVNSVVFLQIESVRQELYPISRKKARESSFKPGK